MDTFNFNAPVNGPIQAGGEGNTQNNNIVNNNYGGQQTAEALRLANELVRQLGATAPPEVEAVQAELARADQQNTAADHVRIRAWLSTISQGAVAGSGTLALVEGIRQAVGG
ncbi:hypothetical protein OG607_33215 [Streptomyces sp. NBC_01537]|uniref:hypothetical protein n=1 Tax=Streptomyces sp. NBC_01537 TaxID=2903896 RepID=UPI003868FC1F